MTSRHHDYRFQVLNKERGRRFVAIRDRSCPFVSVRARSCPFVPVRARSLISDTDIAL